MTVEYFTARQAAMSVEAARSLEGAYLKEHTLSVLALIKDLASKGETNITIDDRDMVDQVIVDRLISLGYVATITRDQRDGDSLFVSWAIL